MQKATDGGPPACLLEFGLLKDSSIGPDNSSSRIFDDQADMRWIAWQIDKSYGFIIGEKHTQNPAMQFLHSLGSR